jgi:hypothetical protein
MDLRAVSRSGGLFVGLIAAPLAAVLSDWWWGWCLPVALGAAIAGFVLAGAIGRVLFPAPPGQTTVVRVSPAALSVALRASVAGGFVVALVCAVAAYFGAGGVPAAVTLVVGVGASIGVGCLAALL